MKPRIKKHEGTWWLLIGPYWTVFNTWREAMDRVISVGPIEYQSLKDFVNGRI